jgi:hypothetical protein
VAVVTPAERLMVDHLLLSEAELRELVDDLLRENAQLTDDLAASYRREVQGRRRIAALNAQLAQADRGREGRAA